MSSNLRIKKICQFCYSEFIAKTTKTKYCSLRCAQRAYKQRVRDEKIKQNKLESKNLISKVKGKSKSKKAAIVKKNHEISSRQKSDTIGENTNYDKINHGEIINAVMSVGEAADFLNVSCRTIYNMIRTGNLKAYNINKRLTRVKRKDVEDLITFDVKKTDRSETFDESDAYSISDIHNQFNLTKSFIYHKLKEYKVPKKQKGKHVFVPKKLVDLIFKNLT
jgi:excisionase family DNA binding protein